MNYRKHSIRSILTLLLILLFVSGAGVLIGTYLTAPSPGGPATVTTGPVAVAAMTPERGDAGAQGHVFSRQWGIEASTVRLSAGGNVLDFRYKILDVERAAKLSQPEYEAHLLLEGQDKVDFVNPKRSGPLLEGKQKLKGGEYRSLFFANPSQRVKTGDLVTIVIGTYRAENLQVQ